MIPEHSKSESEEEALLWAKLCVEKIEKNGYEGQWWVAASLIWMVHPPSLWLRVVKLNELLTA
jgi:hypothetical protein